MDDAVGMLLSHGQLLDSAIFGVLTMLAINSFAFGLMNEIDHYMLWSKKWFPKIKVNRSKSIGRINKNLASASSFISFPKGYTYRYPNWFQ